MPAEVRTASGLLADLNDESAERISLSVYETGRVTALAPQAPGQRERIAFLLAQQRPDGAWGGPGAYALVPTLSAVDALLASHAGGESVGKGLTALRTCLERYSDGPFPDTVAVELIVPALVDMVNGRLPGPPYLPVRDFPSLTKLRRRVESGAAVPDKLLHTLEIVPDLAPALPGVRLVDGLVCASPAATAAWLGGRTCSRFNSVLEYYGGPVPAFHKIANFERAWVISWLHGTTDDIRRVSLPEPTDGVATAPGLPVDADTTAMTLWALALQGRPHAPDPLWQFERDDHFATWHAPEQTASPTTNAHVLEALIAGRDGSPRIEAGIAKASRWIAGAQRADGSWLDKWHASPYYATCCCALALHRSGQREVAHVLGAAAEWVLATQRPDGGWGLWESTAEETAYAVHVLLQLGRAGEAVAAAHKLLMDTDFTRRQPALWHDKDLYAPYNIIDAAVIAAQHNSLPSIRTL